LTERTASHQDQAVDQSDITKKPQGQILELLLEAHNFLHETPLFLEHCTESRVTSPFKQHTQQSFAELQMCMSLPGKLVKVVIEKEIKITFTQVFTSSMWKQSMAFVNESPGLQY